ncbi:MAG: adenosylmethionine decarboxylase [Bacteroidota bacterium]
MNQALGRHILAELHGISSAVLNSVAGVEEALMDAAKQADATIIQTSFHHFSPHGVSGVVVIQESHLAIHTWPEAGYAALDIFTCGEEMDPWRAYQALLEAWNPANAEARELLRGEGMGTLGGGEDFTSPTYHLKKLTREAWFTQRQGGMALSLLHQGKRLYHTHSEFQRIEVMETHSYGRVLVLDGQMVCAEADEYIYHEMLVHVAMQQLTKVKRVVVLGGGDGGAVRELLKYPTIEHIQVWELDPLVIQVSQEFFPEMGKAFEDKRVAVKIGDGWQVVAQMSPHSVDMIIVDAGQILPEKSLFSEANWLSLLRLLKKEGGMVVPLGPPRDSSHSVEALFQQLQIVAQPRKLHPYLAHLPTYPTGTWAFALIQAKEKLATTLAHPNLSLRYVNEEVLTAAFALPNDLKQRFFPPGKPFGNSGS